MTEKNKLIQGKCTGYNDTGMGVVKDHGFCLFVKGLLQGEEAEIRVLSAKKQYGYGKIERLLTASKERNKAPCPLYPRCGGCQIMHLSMQEQARLKEERVKEAIQRIAHLDIPVLPILQAENPLHYRNKVQIPVQMNNGKLTGGFYRTNSHDIVPMDECLLQSDVANSVWQTVRKLADVYGYGAVLRHVLIKHAFATDEMMVVLITKKTNLPRVTQFVQELVQQEPLVKTIVVNLNVRDDNVILGDKTQVIYGDGYIVDKLLGCKFQISAHSFYQVNPYQTRKLYAKALEVAQITNEDVVADIYGGIGTIGILAAKQCKQVYSVEIVAEAVEDAKQNAVLNHLTNISFVAADAKRAVADWVKQGIRIDVAFIDPPRKGCDKDTIEALVQLGPKRIVYVSCDPGTLARDLAIFKEKGYQAMMAQPVDMFPNTSHVETVVLMAKVYI